MDEGETFSDNLEAEICACVRSVQTPDAAVSNIGTRSKTMVQRHCTVGTRQLNAAACCSCAKRGLSKVFVVCAVRGCYALRVLD